MIREINRSDLGKITALLWEFLAQTSYNKHTANLDIEYIKRIAFSVIEIGYGWILEVNKEPAGILLAVKENNIWIPEKFALKELVWYVKPEYRGTSSAGKLFIKYTQRGEAMLAAGEIDGYFTTRMGTTTDYDLESRGFRLTEKLYIKD